MLLAIPVCNRDYFFNIMKMKSLFLWYCAGLIFLSACTSHSKKILLYASSEIQVDNSQQNITVTDGTTHHEKELEFSGSAPVTLNVQTPAGKFTLEAKEDGLYIANLKTDTVVGSFQHVGTEAGEGRITQDQLTQRIDSLKKLVLGQNQSVVNRNYFIPPNKISKITTATNAKIFGPFTSIPGSFDAGSVPELYKFYTNGEVRDIIAKLSGMNK
jgi:hypothetical protein